MSKFVKKFQDFLNENNKLNETGEWDRRIDWDFVKNNPDYEDEFSGRIKYMEEEINNVQSELSPIIPFVIQDIRGFDNYQGAYAMVLIDDKVFKFWEGGEGENGILYVEKFPIDNCKVRNLNPGFEGNASDVADAIETWYFDKYRDKVEA